MSKRLESYAGEMTGSYRVETRERLAILVPEGAIELNADARRQILQVARSEGFTNVAVELDPDVASLPGD